MRILSASIGVNKIGLINARQTVQSRQFYSSLRLAASLTTQAFLMVKFTVGIATES